MRRYNRVFKDLTFSIICLKFHFFLYDIFLGIFYAQTALDLRYCLELPFGQSYLDRRRRFNHGRPSAVSGGWFPFGYNIHIEGFGAQFFYIHGNHGRLHTDYFHPGWQIRYKRQCIRPIFHLAQIHQYLVIIIGKNRCEHRTLSFNLQPDLIRT
ncbi:hypothetical protein D3C74_362080 [compost metagenome]